MRAGSLVGSSRSACPGQGNHTMPSDFPRGHILAIDDEPLILELFTELLTAEGYRVSAEAMPCVDVAHVLSIAPDLIVLDLLVGNTDSGTTFLEMLKADPVARLLPVLVCSGAHGRLAALDERLRAWHCRVVTKPFVVDAFVAAVASCLAGDADQPATPVTAEAAD